MVLRWRASRAGIDWIKDSKVKGFESPLTETINARKASVVVEDSIFLLAFQFELHPDLT